MRFIRKKSYILEPFKTLTKNLSKRESYFSGTIPLIMALKEFFNQACKAFSSVITLWCAENICSNLITCAAMYN